MSRPAKAVSIEAVLAHVIVDEETGCFVWQRARTKEGYGRIRIGGKMQRAHRVAYALTVGPIPDNLTVDHRCGNPPCVNVTHLELCTAVENVMRGDGVCVRKLKQTHCVHGHALSGENLIVERLAGRAQRRQCRTCKRDRQRALRHGFLSPVATTS